MNQLVKQLCLLFFAALPSILFAQEQTTKLSIESFNIKAGETKEIFVDLENPDMKVWQLQFAVDLPEGISVPKENVYNSDIEDYEEKYAVFAEERASTNHSAEGNVDNGVLYVVVTTSKKAVIKGTSGAVVRIKLTADASFSNGNITIKDILVTDLDNKKYSLSDVSYSIGPKPVTVTVNDATRKYGEANPKFTYSVIPSDVTLDGTVTFSCEASEKSNVGDYAITATSNSDNYIVTCVPGKLTVTPALLKVTAKNAERTYGADNAAFTLTYEGFVNGDTEAVLTEKPAATTTATKTSPVGTYDITVSGGAATNYTISDYVKGTLTVNPATLTVQAGNASRVYGAANPDFAYSISGFVNEESETVLTTKPTVATTATATSAVGSYAITASGAVAPNYSFGYKEGKLTVTKAPLKAIVKNATRTYGGSVNYEFEYSGFVNNDGPSAVTAAPTVSSTATASSPVGTYDISISGGEAPNYDFTEYVGGTLTITPALLKVTAQNAERTYGADNAAFALSYEGFVNGETEAVLTEKPVAMTIATKASPVGKYDITVSGGAATNYTISEYAKGTLTVNPATLTVQAGNASRVYGTANPDFTYSISGFVNDETDAVLTSKPTVSTSATVAFGAGTYAITASGAEAPNYTFYYSEGSLTITKAPLKATVKDATRSYGGTAYYEFEYSGFVNNDGPNAVAIAPTVSSIATAYSPVGTYDISISGGEASNYEFTEYVGGTLTITPAQLTVFAYDAEYAYGSDYTNFAIGYQGFVNGETESVLSEMPVATTTATKTSPVGIYEITVSGGSAENYTIVEYLAGRLTITKAKLTVQANNATRVYGAANPEFTYSISGFVNDETEQVLTTLPLLRTEATVVSPVGSYPISISGGESTNYNFSYVEGKLEVTKAPLKATVLDATCTYGGEATYAFAYEGFVNNDNEDAITTAPTVITTATVGSPVGTYDLTISGGEATNYEFTEYVGGKLTINKALLKVTADNITWMIGKEWPEFTVQYEGFVMNETEAILTKKPEVKTNATKDSPAGIYDITVSGGEAVNYDFEYFGGKLTIVPDDTKITQAESEKSGAEVYDLRGQKVRKGSSNLNDLPKGLYIINGRKVVKK